MALQNATISIPQDWGLIFDEKRKRKPRGVQVYASLGKKFKSTSKSAQYGTFCEPKVLQIQ